MSNNRSKDVLACIPGKRLCLCDKNCISGQGTYVEHGYIHSQIAGLVNITKNDDGINVVTVHSVSEQSIVPQQGDIVTAQVLIITQQYAKCAIMCIGNVVSARPYRAVLKKEDIQATDKDKVEVFKSVLPGDIILARVLPLTEAHTFQLTTAENELGVVIAHGESGHPLVPISWTTMQCTKSYVKQFRKVAKVISEIQN